MKRSEWIKLIIVELEEFHGNQKGLKKGDKFLHGNKVVGQKETKKIGDSISYYIVTGVKNKSIEYQMGFGILKEG
jgi:hypothetical protein